MSWQFSYFEDGDVMSAVSLNAAFDGAKAWLDATGTEGWRRGMLNQHHAATTVRNPGVHTVSSDESGLHVYAESVFTTNLNYNAYGQDDGTSVSSDLGSGFDRTLVGHPSSTGTYAGPTAVLAFAGALGYRVGMSNETAEVQRVGAVEVLFNCEIVEVSSGEPGEPDIQVMFCIQYQLSSGGVWYTIDESERFQSFDFKYIVSGDDLYLDVPIRCLITKEIIDENGDSATDDLIGIRAMVSKYSSAPDASNVSITLGQFTLTAIPWRCKDAT